MALGLLSLHIIIIFLAIYDFPNSEQSDACRRYPGATWSSDEMRGVWWFSGATEHERCIPDCTGFIYSGPENTLTVIGSNIISDKARFYPSFRKNSLPSYLRPSETRGDEMVIKFTDDKSMPLNYPTRTYRVAYNNKCDLFCLYDCGPGDSDDHFSCYSRRGYMHKGHVNGVLKHVTAGRNASKEVWQKYLTSSNPDVLPGYLQFNKKDFLLVDRSSCEIPRIPDSMPPLAHEYDFDK